ncbi:hypothetical protein ABI59_15450 [Acidobacteria bacterium Mor1]|nr:hypothetical protein ABI59_15450 [Acidobacteria bacterium Mor1]
MLLFAASLPAAAVDTEVQARIFYPEEGEEIPVEGALVSIVRVQGAGHVLNTTLRSTRSNTSGHATLGRHTPGFYLIHVHHPEFIDIEQNVAVLTSDEPQIVEIELDPGNALEGRVRDLSGNPRTNVAVQVEGPEQTQELRTDEEGKYRLGGRVSGSYVVSYRSSEGYEVSRPAQFTASGDEVTLDFDERDLVVVQGWVLRRGRPLAGATIGFRYDEPHMKDPRVSIGTTGDNGVYEVAMMDHGYYRVFIETPDQELPLLFDLEIPPGTPLIQRNFELFATGQLSGVVTGPGGRAVAGARVFARTMGAPADAGPVAEAVTGPNGGFELGGLSQGVYNLFATHDDLVPQCQLETFVRARSENRRVNFNLEQGRPTRLEVRGGDEPVDGAIVYLTSTGAPFKHCISGVTGEDGVLEIALPDRPHRVTIVSQNWAPLWESLERLPAGDPTLSWSLDSGGALQVEFADDQGNPAEGVQIRLEGDQPRQLRQLLPALPEWLRSDAEGKLLLERLAPGTYKVFVTGYPLPLATAEVQQGERVVTRATAF